MPTLLTHKCLYFHRKYNNPVQIPSLISTKKKGLTPMAADIIGLDSVAPSKDIHVSVNKASKQLRMAAPITNAR